MKSLRPAATLIAIFLVFIGIQFASAQLQTDKQLQMIGTYPDNIITGAGALGIGIGVIVPSANLEVVGTVRFASYPSGIYAGDATGVLQVRTITGTAGRTTVTNGNGASGNPTVDLETTGTPGSYTKVSTDAYGRVISGSSLSASDLSAGISGTLNYIAKFTGANSIGNSTITDDGTTVGTGSQFDISGGTGTGYGTAPIEIMTNNTPRLAFHRPGVVASQIGMDAAGVIRTYDNPGTGYERFAASTVNAVSGFQYNGTPVIFNSATDVYVNARVLQSNSTLNDGMYVNYNSAGGAAADIRFFANGTNERMRIKASTGYVGILTSSPARPLEVNNAMKFTNGSVDANDGVIGTAPFAAGLNIVGINTDGGGRKVNWWGSFLQNENPVGNSFSGANTFTSLAGTGNRRVFADASGTLSAPANVGFYARKSGNQSQGSGGFARATWESTDFNDAAGFDLANERFVVPAGQGGVYLFTAGMGSSTNTDQRPRAILSLYVNGGEHTRLSQHELNSMNWINRGLSGSVVVKLNAGDFGEIYTYWATSNNSGVTWVPGEGCYFTGARIY